MERFLDMTVAQTLTQMVEKIAEKSGQGENRHNNAGDGVDYEWWSLYWMCICEGGADFNEYGPVIFASGGFGVDFTNNSLQATHCPDLLHLLTTNGEHCTGGAIKMGHRTQDH